MHLKERLLHELWDREDRYFDLAREQVRAAAESGGEYAFLRRWLPVRGTVLEVGCGEGSNVAAVERAGLRFVGCDLSARGVARAKAALCAPVATIAAPIPECVTASVDSRAMVHTHIDGRDGSGSPASAQL